MSTIDDISAAVAAAIGGTPGLSTTDVNPPDVIAGWEFPKALVYPGRSRSRGLTEDAGNGYASRGVLHTVFVDVHVALTDSPLAATLAAGRPFIDSIPEALFVAWYRDKFNGTVDVMGDPFAPDADAVRSDFAEFGWASTPTIGVRTEIDFWFEQEIIV